VGIVDDALEEADALVLRRHNDRLRTDLAIANRSIRKLGARVDELEELMARFRAVRPAASAGIYPSMLKYLHRMDSMWASTGKRIDVHLMGHWHTYLTGPNFLVNGSLVGYNEYAKHGGFYPEKSRQAFAVVTPERGIVQQMPIYAE